MARSNAQQKPKAFFAEPAGRLDAETNPKVAQADNGYNRLGVGAATVVIAYLLGWLFSRLRRSKNPGHAVVTGTQQEEEEELPPPNNFTLEQLQEFTGAGEDSNGKIYVAIRGEVFDVTQSRDFYGPGAGYHLFAGHDASKCLATLSFQQDELNQSWEGLSFMEKQQLDDWADKFKHHKAYPVVGRVVTPPAPREFTLEELRQYDGKGEVPEGSAAAPIYIGAAGKVFDMSYGGVEHYGPGKAYALFAGRDASRALAKMSFAPENLDDPRVSELSADDMKVLQEWVDKFENKKKYPIVGTVKT